MHRPSSVSAAAAALAIAVLSTHAMAATTLKCSKKGKTISEVIASLAPANGYTEIDISGACVDNIYIPPNQAIHLVAATGTTLKPLNATSSAINVEGRLEVDNLAVSVGGANAVSVFHGGFVTILAGTLSGTSIVVQISNGSNVVLQDTAISTGGAIAINNSNGSVEIDGVAGLFGSNGASVTNSANPGVYCAQGNVAVSAISGPVVFNGGGLDLVGCNLKMLGSAANPIVIENTGTTTGFLPGLALTGGSAVVTWTQIINNNNLGLFANEGADIEVSAVTITGNVGQAMNTNQNAMIHIVPYSGINTITEPSGNTQPLFGCYQGGNIYVDQIAGTITPAPTQSDIGCLTVGG